MKFLTAGLLLGCFAALSTATDWTPNSGPVENVIVQPGPRLEPTMETDFYGTAFHVIIDWANLTNCSETSAGNLSGVPWTIQVCKAFRSNANFDFHLIADFEDPKWSVEASAVFEIRNANSMNYFRNSLDWKTFTSDTPLHAIRNVLMNTVIADYIAADDKIRLKIEITTKPAQPIELEEVMQKTATKIRFLVKNVTSLSGNNAFLSSEVDLLGIRWFVAASHHESYFAVTLNANPEDLSEVWSVDTKVSIKMMPVTKTGRTPKALTMERDETFSKETPSHKFMVLKWDSIIHPDSDYVVNDSAALLVDIKTSPKKRIILFQG